jgi:hypothetical protein
MVVGLDGRAMKRLLVVLASLLGLIAATAAAGSAERYWALARVALPESTYARWDNAITAASASAVAGLILAVLLTAQVSRALLLLLGLFDVAMLATSEYLRHQSGMTAELVPSDHSGLLLPMWERVVVPSPAVTLLAVALIWVAVSRRPVVTFAGFPAATVEPRRPVAGGLLAILLGALVWAAAGLSLVAFAAADFDPSLDFGGFVVAPNRVQFGSVTVLYVVAAAALIVAAGLYTALLSRRLHPSEPIAIGVLFGLATVVALVNTLGSARSTIALPSSSPFLVAVLLGVQVMAGAPGALLAVPLIATGVWRLRADRPAPTSSPTYAVSNDPTIPLY